MAMNTSRPAITMVHTTRIMDQNLQVMVTATATRTVTRVMGLTKATAPTREATATSMEAKEAIIINYPLSGMD